MLSLPATKTLTAVHAKPALDFLIGYAPGERQAAQGRLNEAAALPHQPSSRNASTCPRSAHAPRGDSPPATFGDLAAGRLGQLLGSLTLAAEANPSTPAELHQLRILAKQVR